MKTSRKFFAALLVAIMVTVNFASTGSVFAAATDPYCRISYDSSVGCNTVKYYYFPDNSAKYDASRLVKFYDGKILLGSNNTQVTVNHKAGTNPAWTQDGAYLIWIESDASLQCRTYNGTANAKIADGVLSIGLNAESMVATVTFSDNSSKPINDLLPPTVTSTVAPTVTVTATATPTSTSTPMATANVAPVVSVQEWTDSADQEHWKFAKNEVIVDGSNVYFNDFKISDLCNSGVRFVGVDTSNRVYLYEDDSQSFYRFSEKNIFSPEKIKFSDNCKLESVNTDSNGFMIEVVTSNGTFKVSQLVVDKIWYPSINFTVNKNGYCTHYIAETNTTYNLHLEGSKLYCGKKLVTDGVTRSTESFGCEGEYLWVLKGSLVYQAPLKNPTKLTLVKQNGAKLTYSKKNGAVNGVKRLSVKKDYVRNFENKSIWYQGGKKFITVSLSKAKTIKVLLNGKVIKKFKKGTKIRLLGITEKGDLKLYVNNKTLYTCSLLNNPKKFTAKKSEIAYGYDSSFVIVSIPKKIN